MSIEEIIEKLQEAVDLGDSPHRGPFGTHIRKEYLVEAIERLKTHPEAQSNEPLTLEELRDMDGQAVRLDVAGGMWALVEAQNLTLWLDRGGRYDATAFVGKIYRRPPEEN